MNRIRLILILLAGMPLFPSNTIFAEDELPIVIDSRAVAKIIIPDDPLQVHQFAADELQYHLEKSTGAKLQIVHENKLSINDAGNIYLGPCRQTIREKILVKGLRPNGYHIQLVNRNLYFSGDDSKGSVIEINGLGSIHNNQTHVGTLFAVYEFLEVQLGVRWLWPGPLGEVIPKRKSISIKNWEKREQTKLVHARMRDYGFRYINGWQSQKAARQYTFDVAKWMRRHRMAIGVDMDASHAYTNWWKEYGKEHPEWFALRPNNIRGPGGAPQLVQMCVSQPSLWREIVERWKKSLPEVSVSGREKKLLKRANQFSSLIDVSENDSDGSTPSCTCKSCRDWDGPNGHISDRYAKFWLAVQKEAEKERPDARIITIAYDSYFQPPKKTKLNDRIIIGIVPGFYFPWSDKNRQQFRNQWQGWANTGARLYLRPNWLHFGHNFPFNYARKLGEDFSFAYDRGMLATDIDLVPGPWATQGLTYYVLGRIHRHPDWSIDRIMQEYYSGFAHASEEVKAYFTHWEQVTESITHESYARGHINKGIGNNAEHKLYLWGNHFFTDKIMNRGKELLHAAKAAAAGDPVSEQRVAFLEMGFQDVELTLETQKSYEKYMEGAHPNEYITALSRLDEHRKNIEKHNTSAMGWIRSRETNWNRSIARDLTNLPGHSIAEQARFMWDPENLGDKKFWHQPDFDDSNWHKINTSSAWEEQPVGLQWKIDHGKPYNGVGWYRIPFQVEKNSAKERHRLIFGSVSKSCKVWVNGELVLTRPFPLQGDPNSASRSFEIEITDQVKNGQNLLTVVVDDHGGQGGITSPVYLDKLNPDSEKDNLVPNGSFEKGITGWQRSTMAGDMSYGHDQSTFFEGNASGVIACTKILSERHKQTRKRAWGRFYQKVSIKPGKKYRLMANVKTSSGFRGEVRIWFGGGNHELATGPTQGLWKQLVLEPVSANSTSTIIYLNIMDGTGQVWFDGISLEPIKP